MLRLRPLQPALEERDARIRVYLISCYLLCIRRRLYRLLFVDKSYYKQEMMMMSDLPSPSLLKYLEAQ